MCGRKTRSSLLGWSAAPDPTTSKSLNSPAYAVLPFPHGRSGLEIERVAQLAISEASARVVMRSASLDMAFIPSRVKPEGFVRSALYAARDGRGNADV